MEGELSEEVDLQHREGFNSSSFLGVYFVSTDNVKLVQLKTSHCINNSVVDLCKNISREG